LFERRVGAAVDLYLESMSEVLAVCEAERRPCWVALQPNRALTSARTGGATPDVLSTRRMVQIYDMLRRRLAGHRYRERFFDLAGVFDSGERERYFTDPVHVSDSGQPLIAEALVAPIASSLAAPLPRGRAVDRCAALTQPQLLAVVPLDGIAADGDGQVSRSEGVVALRADPRQWAFAAHATIELDPAWFSRQIAVRIRLAVSKGDVSVVVLDESTAPSQPTTATQWPNWRSAAVPTGSPSSLGRNLPTGWRAKRLCAKSPCLPGRANAREHARIQRLLRLGPALLRRADDGTIRTHEGAAAQGATASEWTALRTRRKLSSGAMHMVP
jgi:hypothetical protein